jgi:hypothetical protein
MVEARKVKKWEHLSLSASPNNLPPCCPLSIRMGGDPQGRFPRVVVDISWLILLCIYGRPVRNTLARLLRPVPVQRGVGEAVCESSSNACQGTTLLSHARASHGTGALHRVWSLPF